MSNGVDHLVIFKFKDDTNHEHIEAARAALLGLKQQIPCIERLTAGINFADRGRGFQLALCVSFADRAALQAYGEDAAHKQVVESYIAPHLEELIVADYDT